jgi:hypothetical protein
MYSASGSRTVIVRLFFATWSNNTQEYALVNTSLHIFQNKITGDLGGAHERLGKDGLRDRSGIYGTAE